MKFPKLYKRSVKDGLQEWEIKVVEEKGLGKIVTRWGQVGGAIQEVEDNVSKGKNIGKTNETSPYEQACAEAKSKWQKHKDKHHYDEAADGDLDSIKTKAERVSAGSIEPMLAGKWKDRLKHLDPEMEVIAQIKLNGLRCVAVKKNGKVTLYTRGGKFIKSVPAIVAELEAVMPEGAVWDGELCTEDCKPTSAMFQRIIGAARRDNHTPDADLLYYHVFDNMSEDVESLPYNERIFPVVDVLQITEPPRRIKQVKSGIMKVKNVEAYEAELTADGYEGVIVRMPDAPYEHKRTNNLLKVKTFIDDEFEIVDVLEGRGTRAGIAGRVVCKMKDGTIFEAGISGSHEQAEELLKGKRKIIGKMCTIRYFTKTGDGKPYLPVFYGVREEE